MNTLANVNKGLGLAAVSLSLAVGLLSTSALGQQAGAQQRSAAVVRSVDGDNSDVIELRIEDGKVTIKRNGEEVPEAQIRREGGRFVILDAQGNPVDEASLWVPGESGTVTLAGENMGALADVYRARAAVRENPPKVMIGVQTAPPGPALEKHLRLEPGQAIMISGLYEGLPAHEAGLDQYDIVIKVDGQPIVEGQGIVKLLADKNAGDKVKLGVIHQGEPREVTLTLVEYDASRLQEAKLIGGAPMFSTIADTLTVPDIEIQELPMWQRFLFTPDQKQFFQQYAPTDAEQRSWRGSTQPLLPPAAPSPELDQRLQRLDERLAELERMLGKLVEQNKGAR